MIMLRHKIKKCEFVLKFVFCLAFSIIMYIVVGVFAVAPYGDNPVEKEETETGSTVPRYLTPPC